MTRGELEMHAERFLQDSDPKARKLQTEICREFVEVYGADPRLASITEHKQHWVISHLGSFTIGFVKGMDREPSKTEQAMLRLILGM